MYFSEEQREKSRRSNRIGELYPISSNSWQAPSSRSSLRPLLEVFVEPEMQIVRGSHNLPVSLTDISVRDMLNIFECLIRDGKGEMTFYVNFIHFINSCQVHIMSLRAWPVETPLDLGPIKVTVLCRRMRCNIKIYFTRPTEIRLGERSDSHLLG